MKLQEIIVEVRSWKEGEWTAFALGCSPLVGIVLGLAAAIFTR